MTRLRQAARALLACGLIATMAASLWQAVTLARDPMFAPLAERSAAEIAAATDQMMAREATPERLAARIEKRLVEDPRNWVVLKALREVAAERALPLPDDLRDRLAEAEARDERMATGLKACMACFWNTATCSLGNVLVCKAPEVLTPLGDVAGLARAGVAQATGGDLDEVDLGLSVVGLGATALTLGTGGSSYMVKLGAGTARVAHGMKILSPRLTATGAEALRRGVDWAALPAIRSAEDIARAMHPERLAPVAAVVAYLGRISRATGPAESLHLLRYVDEAAEARQLARASEALGAKTVGRVEMLGKGRLLRSTLRLSEHGWRLSAALLAFAATLAAFVGGLAQAWGLRLLRRLAG